jgi:serine/threonine protein kinase
MLAVHRDIAARNVLLTSTFEPKICDFGLSRLLESSESGGGVTSSNTGPLRHMAPESIRDKKYSAASDVWSWGVMLFETLTAQTPYKELSPLQAATQVVLGLRLKLPSHIQQEWPILAKLFNRVPVP